MEALKVEPLDAIADRGYFIGAELLSCHEAGITATGPTPETSNNLKKGMFVKADFVYDGSADTYVCPAGKALAYRHTTEETGLLLRRYWRNDCASCLLKTQCTTEKERRVTRCEHEHLIDAMYSRMEDNPSGDARPSVRSEPSRRGWAQRISRCAD
ncbi:transposase (plasmid) [Neorhizobium sp. NCHU2750]|nr:transposase [Neorhizobium sp. NCHU2750]